MSPSRRPEWLQKKISPAVHRDMDGLLDGLRLHTVCREAHCPNISECYDCGQATFLILGTVCTRLCSFCNVTKREPLPPDRDEPGRVAEAVQHLGLRHAVITSPTRDDLPDGGAGMFAETVRAIRTTSPDTAVELLIPDFGGVRSSLELVVSAGPDILGHNLETVPRLYHIRAGAEYRRSIAVLGTVRDMAPSLKTKSGLMLGMGEEEGEVDRVFADLLENGCRYLSIGQYLAPSKRHYPVREYLLPEAFDRYREKALSMGFLHVESGPYVRSSYHAERYGKGC
jgi:lipoic acid synthetase